MIILDGKKTANDIKEEIAVEVNSIISSGGKKPHLSAILVDDLTESRLEPQLTTGVLVFSCFSCIFPPFIS